MNNEVQKNVLALKEYNQNIETLYKSENFEECIEWANNDYECEECVNIFLLDSLNSFQLDSIRFYYYF